MKSECGDNLKRNKLGYNDVVGKKRSNGDGKGQKSSC